MHQPSKITAATLLAGLGVLSGVSFANAVAPMDLNPGVRILDTTNTLGSTSQLSSDITKLGTDHHVNLFVVTIDKFESPSNATEWTSKFAYLNNLGTNDVVLVIATQDRQAKFVAGSSKTLSSDQVNSIYQDYIYPKLKNSDYNGAAEAAVTGINNKLGSGISGGLGSSSNGALVGGGAALLGVGALAAGGVFIASRRRKKNGSTTSSNGYTVGSDNLTPIPQLKQEASSKLIQLDDAIARAQQDLDFASLQYGQEATAPYQQAVEDAKTHRARVFQLQKQLDDDIPDTEADQRSWLGEIISRCQDAVASLAANEKTFSDLRRLESDLPQALAQAKTLSQQVDTKIPVAQQALANVQAKYADSAIAPFADNIQQAQDRRQFALSSLQEAENLKDSNKSQAILSLRAAEEALGQSSSLLDTVINSEAELDKAQQSLQSSILLAERDIAQAKEYSKFGSTSELSGAAAGVSAVLDSIKQNANAQRPDPLALTEQLQQLRGDLDKALGNVRQSQEADANALEMLKHTLVSAQAQVNTASDYVMNRRGGVGTQARTLLSEAERHLAQAQELQFTQPSVALTHANNAISLAAQAQREAQADVGNFSTSYGNSGGGFNSAMLGGILLGTMLGNHSGYSGGFGRGYNGGFGGGFGGGFSGGNDDGFGGGFGGGGDWGGDGGAGGNF